MASPWGAQGVIFPMNDWHAGEWDGVSRWELVGFLSAAAGFMVWIAISPSGFVPVVDHANLLFHEAGHVFAGLVSSRLEPYGGTLGQLFWPAALAVMFQRRRQTLSCAGAGLWFFENFLNIARYVADARAQVLPLVGGGEHDWNGILARWRLLQWDTRIGTGVEIIGWAGMLGTVVWVCWRAWRDRARRNDDEDRIRGC